MLGLSHCRNDANCTCWHFKHTTWFAYCLSVKSTTKWTCSDAFWVLRVLQHAIFCMSLLLWRSTHTLYPNSRHLDLSSSLVCNTTFALLKGVAFDAAKPDPTFLLTKSILWVTVTPTIGHCSLFNIVNAAFPVLKCAVKNGTNLEAKSLHEYLVQIAFNDYIFIAI